MIRTWLIGTIFLFACALWAQQSKPHFIVLDPGHSHAAAVFAQPIPGIADEVHVYAPPGPEIEAFLRSVSQFNRRPKAATHWRIQSHIGPDFLSQMLLEPPGNLVVISGRNAGKIERILASLRAGQNVLADKPWIIDSQDLPLLEAALDVAAKQHRVAYDCMTERFNVAYQIQRELLRDPAIFGSPLRGSAAEPAVQLENLHSLVKFSAGKVNLRPAWFLDVRQQGEAITDVGTHLVDLELWTLFPDQAIEYRRDVRILKANRTPIFLTRSGFERLTGEQIWPDFLRPAIRNNVLEYDCNNTALFTVRGIYTAISDRWEYESVGASSDSYLVLYRGSRATIRVRQSKAENYLPELDVIPVAAQESAGVRAALEQKLQAIAATFPGLLLGSNGTGIRVVIPPDLRERGGSTFAQLVTKFVEYVRAPAALPGWEKPNVLAKYYITTGAAELARRTQ